MREPPRGRAGPGGAAAPPGGPARGCPPAPDTHARPRPPRFLPGRSPGSSPRVSQGAVIHRRVPAPGPGEPQGAGPAVCRHRQPPRRVLHGFCALDSCCEQLGRLLWELTIPMSKVCIKFGVRASDVHAGSLGGLCRRLLLHLGSARSHCRERRRKGQRSPKIAQL